MNNNKKCYNLYLSSTDKISGTHNNPTFNINWDTFLPRNKFFLVNFSFLTAGGLYNDVMVSTNVSYSQSNIKITSNLIDAHYSLDSTTNGPSNTLGYAYFDCNYVFVSGSNNMTGVSKSNAFTCPYGFNPSKIIYRPQNTNLQFWIYNVSALTQSYSAVNSQYFQVQLQLNGNGTLTYQSDMTAWNMVLSFVPLDDNELTKN